MTDDSGRTSPVNSEEASSTVNISDDTEDDVNMVVPPKKAKKRVQFHSDENLVRIREIPPRSAHTTDDEDSGCSDDSEDEDDDDDDEEDSDNDDDENWSSRENVKPGSNMPTIVNNAVKLDCVPKRSYDVSRTKGRTSHIVAQITGVSSRPKPRKNSTKDRKTKKVTKSTVEKPTESSKSKQRNGRKKSLKKLESDKEKIIPQIKKTKEVKSTKTSSLTLAKTSSPRPYGRCLSPIKKTPKQDIRPSVVSSLPNGFDKHLASTNLALQTMSVGKLYTVEGFIFPSDPSEDIKTKSLDRQAESENEKSDVSKAVLQRKKCFAWQMANGDQQNLLFGTPCILPMWDSVHSHPPSTKNGLKTKI